MDMKRDGRPRKGSKLDENLGKPRVLMEKLKKDPLHTHSVCIGRIFELGPIRTFLVKRVPT